MDLVYILKLETPTEEVDSRTETISEFQEIIDDVESFCNLFDFHVHKTNQFWGDENEATYYLRQSGIHFVLVREVSVSELSLISSAVKSFITYNHLKVLREDIKLIKPEE